MGLTVSRREGEFVKVGEHIRVLVTEVRSGRVEIDIEAPKDLAIIRSNADERMPVKKRERPARRGRR